MRIGLIVNQFPALSETFILRQITGLIDRGHDVNVFAYTSGNDPVMHSDIARYDLLRRTYYLNGCACSDPAPIRFLKRAALVCRNIHHNQAAVLRTLDIARFGKRALFLQVACQVIPFLQRGDYDIIHAQFGNLSEAALLLKATGFFRGKLVTSFRGYDISSYVETYGAAAYADLFRSGDLFLCVSDHIRKKLLRLGCADQKVVVHRSGVDLKTIKPRQETARSSSKVRLLTIARLTAKKGVEYSIRAVAKLSARYPEIEYVVAGDGPLMNKLRSLIDELRVGPTVRLVGWKSQDEITKLLGNSDILIAPSVTTKHGEQEGIPGVIMEAFAHRVSVLSTDHAGIGEVVTDGESGFLVREADAEALAEKLEQLVRLPSLRDQMGLKGREFVERHCDIDKLNDRLVSIYGILLDTEKVPIERERDNLRPAAA